MSNDTITETTKQHWERAGLGTFNADVHHTDIRQGNRISFPGAGDVTVHGFVGSLTSIGYRVAVFAPGLPNDPIWVNVDGVAVTPAPLTWV